MQGSGSLIGLPSDLRQARRGGSTFFERCLRVVSSSRRTSAARPGTASDEARHPPLAPVRASVSACGRPIIGPPSEWNFVLDFDLRTPRKRDRSHLRSLEEFRTFADSRSALPLRKALRCALRSPPRNGRPPQSISPQWNLQFTICAWLAPLACNLPFWCRAGSGVDPINPKDFQIVESRLSVLRLPREARLSNFIQQTRCVPKGEFELNLTSSLRHDSTLQRRPESIFKNLDPRITCLPSFMEPGGFRPASRVSPPESCLSHLKRAQLASRLSYPASRPESSLSHLKRAQLAIFGTPVRGRPGNRLRGRL